MATGANGVVAHRNAYSQFHLRIMQDTLHIWGVWPEMASSCWTWFCTLNLPIQAGCLEIDAVGCTQATKMLLGSMSLEGPFQAWVARVNPVGWRATGG